MDANLENGSSPRLSDFIEAHRPDILARWEEAVRTRLAPAREVSQPVLIDHMPEILERVAAITRLLERGGASHLQQEGPRDHALDRLDRGFDLEVVVQEYALVRQVALGLYRERARSGVVKLEEVEHFDLALDQAIRASVSEYAHVRHRTLAALDRVSTAALDSASLDELLPRLLRALMESAESVDSVTILLADGERLHVRAAVGLTEERDASFSLRIGEGFAGTIAATREPLALRDASADPIVVSEVIRQKGIRALYGVPLVAGDELVGVAHIGSLTAFEFSAEDRLLFRTAASRAAHFMAEARLKAAREQAELALRTQNARYEAVVNALSDFDQGLAVVEGHAVRHVNDAFARITGYSVEELLAMPDVAALFVNPKPNGVPTHGEQPRRYQTTLRRKDGALRILDVTSKPIPGGLRVVLGQDVTDRLRQTEASREDVAFRDRLIGIFSHDLRNPITAIRATTAALRRPGGPKRSTGELAARIDRSAARIQEMMSGLLDFTHTRFRGGLVVSKVPTDLRALCEQTIDEIHAAFPRSNVEPEFSGELQANVDPGRIAQVLSNLLTNAVRHGAQDEPIKLRVRGEGDHVVLEVSNHGPTIPPEVLPRIFEAFTRGNNRPGAPEGFGLGLYITDQIVRSHQGHIDVHSSPEEGTTFKITLPR